MAGTVDAPTLRRAMELYLEALREHRDEIDSLNVYPVPDGDTGTNMLLTQQAVVAALASSGDGDVAAVGAVVARASLMGARGNSGVILSQVLRGLFERLPSSAATAGQVAEALEHAAAEAFRAVAQPAEGTVLTVLRDAAAAAREAARGGMDVRGLAEAVVEEARAAVARTREIHPDLHRADVVDAGGKGILLLFDAIRTALTGKPSGEPVGPYGPIGRTEGHRIGGPLEFSYEVQFLLEATDGAILDLRPQLAGLGDSVVVVGGGGLYNVHVHTNVPGSALERGIRAGTPRQVSIAYLPDQTTPCLADQARGVRLEEQVTGLVAVAEGPGLVQAFASLGAVVVSGGPGNNPSVADLLEAIEAAPVAAVLVLPNHRNVLPAAERAAAESAKDVVVVRSLSIPSGIAAATAFNPMAALAENEEAVEEAASSCRAGQAIRADRDAETSAGPVRAGQWLGLAAGKAVAVGDDPAGVVTEVARSLVHPDAEVLTLVVGEGVSQHERDGVTAALRADLPDLQLEVLDGGQPRHPYLIGVE